MTHKKKTTTKHCRGIGLSAIRKIAAEAKANVKAEIRLACMECDREDFDGISELPADWYAIDECGPLDETSRWWTHVGWCPDCLRENG